MDDVTVPSSARGPGTGSAHPDGADVDPRVGADVDPDLRQRAHGLLTLPLDERAAAFDELNRDVAAALRAIEEL